MSRNFISGSLLCVTLLCFYAGSYNALLQYHTNENQRNNSVSGIWTLPPTALRAISGEFKGIIASYLTLDAGSKLGTKVIRGSDGKTIIEKKKINWVAIHRQLVASQILDPSFAQTYITVQGWLPWEPVNMVKETQEFLKITARNRPWDWRPSQTMGFNEYYFLNNSAAAGRLFFESAQAPNSPYYLTILGARLAQKGGETSAAISIMKSMLLDKTQEGYGYNLKIDRLHALEGVLLLEQAVIKYEKIHGNKPVSLEELIKSSTLDKLPHNPYEVAYCIDSVGRIYFDKPNCRQP